MEEIDTIFADPPDNIGLGYDTYKDKPAKRSTWACCKGGLYVRRQGEDHLALVQRQVDL